ncbi:Transmembrane protein adipocyte-associated 1 [Vigna unguiculata]|uniref:Transmembrane protein adipocyte-associated 1 n=1 Tax=Vigna unguiculata TaxID=3917 RepID=A0A4D6KJP0_VIGUN|nr:Transmembrane protein adipocyte-associated 1 [Vigna unguiculata]
MVPQTVISQVSDLRGLISNGSTHGFFDLLFECHGLWHNATLIIPSFLFVLYLILQARHSFLKLSLSRSFIILSYNALLWLATLLNLAWCLLQAWECTSKRELSWNLLSLFTTSGMLFLEVSLVAFLLQGNNAGGLEAMKRTFGISTLVVGLDILLKAFYLFVFGIPLFVDSNENANHVKWNLLIVHKLVLTAVYGFLMFMYHSGWRETLPAKIAFYKYVAVMFIFNATVTLACGLTGNDVAFGLWLYRVAVVLYHAFYLPFLYTTFQTDFFQEENFHLENVYYSEMKDAGFFDTDWE